MLSKTLVLLGLCVDLQMVNARGIAMGMGPRRRLGSYKNIDHHPYKNDHGYKMDSYDKGYDYPYYRRRLEEKDIKSTESSDYGYGKDDYDHKGYKHDDYKHDDYKHDDYKHDEYEHKSYGKGYGSKYGSGYGHKKYGKDCDDKSYGNDYYSYGKGYGGKDYGYYPDYYSSYGGDYGYDSYYPSYGGDYGYGGYSPGYYSSYDSYPGYGGYGFDQSGYGGYGYGSFGYPGYGDYGFSGNFGYPGYFGFESGTSNVEDASGHQEAATVSTEASIKTPDEKDEKKKPNPEKSEEVKSDATDKSKSK